MAEKDFFRFKKFKLKNRDAALKINVDGVLLAAWAELSTNETVLDIGTGGGVIAFILAYDYPSSIIYGIDNHTASIEEAKYNLSINTCQNISFELCRLQQFEAVMTFAHLICNPPFFTGMSSNNAKHDNTLKLEELFSHSKRLLSENGRLTLIIPYEKHDEAITLGETFEFGLARMCKVRGKKDGSYKRCLMEFTLSKSFDFLSDEMYIRESASSSQQYSDAYMNLTKHLYLNF